MFLGAAMKAIRRSLIGGIVLMITVSPLAAQVPAPSLDFAQEQALVARLGASGSVEDQRTLAELLQDGLVASIDNPLRRSDRDGAIAAYRRAMTAGDNSAATAVALSRLLLRKNDSDGLAALMPLLRKLMLQGNGDAAYVLALDAAQNQKLPPNEVVPRLEAAAMMGSMSAVMDLAASGEASGGTIARTSVETLQQRAQAGSAPASFALYQIYRQGMLVERSPTLAMKWLAFACDQGHVTAIERYAEHLLKGTDVTADPTRAATLFRAAADAGSTTAAMALGRNAGPAAGTGVSIEEGRLWLRRAAEVGMRGAAVEISSIDLGLALASNAPPAEMARMIEAALVPIARDPDALANLANRHWKTGNAKVIGPSLLPLLKEQALAGSPEAGLAYNAWLQVNGEPLPEDVAQALVGSLHKNRLGSVGFSNFSIANLAFDGRLSDRLVSKAEATELLMSSADAKVGQAMWKLGQLYLQGDQLAPSVAFAKRWLAGAKAQAVERASWDLAALQLKDDAPEERATGERFYLEKLDEGDARAALAIVGYRLQENDLDAATLAQARQAVQVPQDVIELASLLIASGLDAHVAAGKHMLALLNEGELDTEALISYGRLLVLTASSDANGERGLKLLAKAAETGAAPARVALAATYLSSVTFKDKQEYAVSVLRDVLKDNPQDPDARLLLSKAYLVGLGTKRDARQASDLITSIRAEGEYRNPKATMLAADWLAFSAVDRNPKAAVELLKVQAARGSVAAEREVGEIYLSGFSPSLEPDAAASRLYTAAKAGDKEAMASFGHLLLNGYGVSQSRQDGLAWLGRASEAGNTAAMYELSRIFALRPQDKSEEKQSLYWLRRAAERGHPNASYQLGLTYLAGDGGEPDVDQATVWFSRSAASGNLLAARTLETLRQQMAEGATPDISEVSHE
jgi:TPR repeat protein